MKHRIVQIYHVIEQNLKFGKSQNAECSKENALERTLKRANELDKDTAINQLKEKHKVDAELTWILEEKEMFSELN